MNYPYDCCKSYKALEDIENLSVCIAFRDDTQALCVRKINDYSDIEDYKLVLIDQAVPVNMAGTRFIIKAGDCARGVKIRV